MSDYEWIDRGRRREQVLVSVMNKPRMPSEARDILGYKKGNKLDFTMRELHQRGLLRLKAKGISGLTQRGQRLRKKLCKEKGLTCAYTEPRLDWKIYVWVMLGIQRKTLLRVLERHPTIAAQLLRLARKIHARLSRTDTYKVLKEFVIRKLAESEKNERNVAYVISRKGDAIKNQMLLGWLMMFGFF